jgi:hypothetical protein
MRRIRTLLVVGATVMVSALPVLPTTHVDGWALNGCRFGTTTPKAKFVSTSSLWQIYHNFGASRWNSFSLGFTLGTTTSTTRNMDVYSANYTAGWWGLTTGGCGVSGIWNNNRVTIQYNERTTASLTSDQKESITTHELGHALGSAHAGTVNCGNPAIMYTDPVSVMNSCGTAFPYADDRAGIDTLY